MSKNRKQIKIVPQKPQSAPHEAPAERPAPEARNARDWNKRNQAKACVICEDWSTDRHCPACGPRKAPPERFAPIAEKPLVDTHGG